MRTQLLFVIVTLSLTVALVSLQPSYGVQEPKPAVKGPEARGALVDQSQAPQLPQEAPVDQKAKEVPIGMVPPGRLPGQAGDDLPFSLMDLVLAKIDDDAKKPQLVVLIEQSRTQRRTVTVTKLVQEVRTRKVRVADKDGKVSEVDQDYTVTVPVTEEVEQLVHVPAGKKPTTFPLNELRIYRLDGTKLTEASARKELEKFIPVFLLRGYKGDIKAVEGVYLQALNPGCLIVATEKAE